MNGQCDHRPRLWGGGGGGGGGGLPGGAPISSRINAKTRFSWDSAMCDFVPTSHRLNHSVMPSVSLPEKGRMSMIVLLGLGAGTGL